MSDNSYNIVSDLYLALQKRLKRDQERLPEENLTLDDELEWINGKQDCCLAYFISKNPNSSSLIEPKPSFKMKRACYYNSIVYARKYPDVNLAWGYTILKRDFKKFKETAEKSDLYPSIVRTIHAFCIDKEGNIIDPTWGLEEFEDEVYFYELVPREVWSGFSHKDEDLDFNGRDFSDYIYRKIDQYEIKGVEWFKKITSTLTELRESIETKPIRLKFAFFYQLSKAGYAILKKDKEFVKKYIIYAILSPFRPYKLLNYYLHLPSSTSGIMQLSFSFDIEFEKLKFSENKLPEFKSFIETKIQDSLKSKKLIV